MKVRTLAAGGLFVSPLLIFVSWGCGPRRAAAPVVAVEAHSEALPLWLELGIKNATLIHIDAHDDLRPIPPDKAEALKDLAVRRDLNALRRADSFGVDGLYDEGSLVSAAARLSVVRDVVWVVPGRDRDQVQALSSRAGRLAPGLPVMVCPLEEMPSFSRPVLVGIDLDFLPEFACERGLTDLEAARRLARVLGERVPRRIQVVMCYSTGDGYTPVLLRWLGDALLDFLMAYPSGLIPERGRIWAFLAEAERLRRAGAHQALIDMIDSRPRPLLGAAAGWLYLADAFYFRDEIERSFKACLEACRLDKRSAVIFLWVARGLAIEGRTDEAARFIAAGREADPRVRDWKAEAYLALALEREGRGAEAVAVWERLSAHYTSYSAEFLIGKRLLEMGDGPGAGRRFDEAVRRLDLHPDIEADFPEVCEAVVSAVRYYEVTGRTGRASRLRCEPRFRDWFGTD